MPKRIQRRRTKGWRMPANTVYVGRPTKWGNPYTYIAPWDNVNKPFREALALTGFLMPNADACERRYRLWLHEPDQAELLAQLNDLRGKNLACWCGNGPCHADVLLELANR